MSTRLSLRLPAAVLVLLASAACSSPPPPPSGATSEIAGAAEQRRVELEKRRDRVEADRDTIGPFRLISSRYRHEVQEDGWQRPMLDLVLENGTRLPVAHFTVLLTLASPGRKEPWLRQEFVVNMTGTLPPGVRHETTLTPSPDSPWAKVPVSPDARMRVDVMTVRTPEGQEFLGPGAFTPQDAAELVSLSKGR